MLTSFNFQVRDTTTDHPINSCSQDSNWSRNKRAISKWQPIHTHMESHFHENVDALSEKIPTAATP